MSDSIPITPKPSALWDKPILRFTGGLDDDGKPTGDTIELFRCPVCFVLVDGGARLLHEDFHRAWRQESGVLDRAKR